jgi:hypothetical protein
MANLRIAELDFDTIKTNLKTYLQSQNEFSDYDFEGAGLSVLIDILAYNTHYNAYLANMLANEMFLDSSVKRSSAVSIAKHLGYTPKSVTGSKAFLDITVNNPVGSPATLTLDRYASFSTTVNGTAYTFLTTEPFTIQPSGGIYSFENIPVKEGRLLEYSHTVVSPGPDEKYEIPNSTVDTSTMLVTVQNSSTDTTTTTYTLSTDITTVTGTSTVYFLEENTLGNYQIYFGDGVLGKKLVAGNIIRIQYLACTGSVANVSGNISQTFTAGNAIGGSNNITVITASNSTGGAERESISSIKFNAPRANLARNRAVTKADYSSIIKAQYSQVESISVWGGEENEPPVYGKVLISLKPFSGFVIDDITKTEIKNTILKDRNVLTVTPEFVDPDYIYVNLTVNANYNKNLTTLNASQISNLLRNEIVSYFNTNLQQFEKPFYYSQLLEALNNVDNSVLSVLVDVKIQKRLVPILNIQNAYINENVLRFNNKLNPGNVESTRFFIVRDGTTITVRMYDVPDVMPPDVNGTGTLRLYNVNDGTDLGSIGTVNYSTGIISISGITPVGYPSNQFEIIITADAQEDSYNITSSRNQIIVVDDSTENTSSNRLQGITVNVTAV